MMQAMLTAMLLLCSAVFLGQVPGGLKPVTDPDRPRPVRNDVAQAGEEIVTLRYFRIKKGTFDQFVRASEQDVWPYFEKIGSRVIGMWKVIEPDGVGAPPREPKDYDEVYLMTRYASVAHWQATREATLLGGNGPDWDRCKRGLDLRQSLTLASHVIFLQGRTQSGTPYYMPGLRENYEKK